MLRYRLTLAGEPLPGHTNESILVALQQQMGLAPAQAEALLPPASHCIKSGLDARELEHWLHAFHQVGLRVHKEPERDTPTAPSAQSADPPAALLAAMATGFDRRGISPLYRLQLTLVTLCCVLIPLAYLALVAALGYAWWWYLSHIQLLIGRSLHGFHALALVYGVPGLSGGILLLFLIRPMVLRSPPCDHAKRFKRREEPRLIKTVELLATMIGIRPPAIILLSNEVNASVHYEGGWRGFFNGRKVLTIGMPLVAGLSHQQLIGVLAHEFGHFAQRFGMRCSYVVNHVNAWLDLRANYADPWDDRLDALRAKSRHLVVRLMVVLARSGIRMSRVLLRGFFFLSFRLSRSLSRQMEFDADRYEILLCGSASFEQTAVRVRALNQAFTELDKQNAETWREHGLLRNMPAATAARVEAFDASTWAAMRSSMAGGVTRYWDTHPADLDRLGRAHALAAPGMYQDDQPASMLFNRFEFYCQQITLAYYGERNVDHREVELHDQWAGIVPVQRCPSNPGHLTPSPFLL
jgi:Zn-dependent protease with chaperone function